MKITVVNTMNVKQTVNELNMLVYIQCNLMSFIMNADHMIQLIVEFVLKLKTCVSEFNANFRLNFENLLFKKKAIINCQKQLYIQYLATCIQVVKI